MDVKAMVLESLEEIIGVEVDDSQLDLFGEELIDSLAIINLIVLFEGRIGRKIDTRLITNDDFRTPAAIIALIEKTA